MPQKKQDNKQPSMLGAAIIQFVSRYASVGLQLILTAVLARLLTPEEFGTVAIVSVFTSFFAVFADLGISPAIVQFSDLQDEGLNALFTFSALLALCAGAVFFVLSWPIAAIYQDSQLVPLCQITSLSVVFSTLNMVPNGILLRNKEFAYMGAGAIVATLVSGAVGVATAFLHWGCYALVAQTIVLSLIVFAWNFRHAHVRFARTGVRKVLRRIAGFSGFQTAFQFVNYFSRNLDNLLTGALMGPASLGQYDKAYKLMQMPNNYLSGIFSSILQPYLAPNALKLDRIYEFWIRMSKFLAIVGVWATLVFYFCAAEIVDILYGPQWQPAVAALQMLSLSIALQMVNSTGGAIFQSIEHTDYLFLSGLIDAGISITCILVGCVGFKNLAALGACVSVAYVGHTCVNYYYIVRRGLQRSALRAAWQFARIVLATVAVFFVFALAQPLLPALPSILGLLLKTGILTLLLLGALLVVGERSALGFVSYARTIGTE